jgi:hypothetical protein
MGQVATNAEITIVKHRDAQAFAVRLYKGPILISHTRLNNFPRVCGARRTSRRQTRIKSSVAREFVMQQAAGLNRRRFCGVAAATGCTVPETGSMGASVSAAMGRRRPRGVVSLAAHRSFEPMEDRSHRVHSEVSTMTRGRNSGPIYDSQYKPNSRRASEGSSSPLGASYEPYTGSRRAHALQRGPSRS